jgi:hypothetical protein
MNRSKRSATRIAAWAVILGVLILAPLAIAAARVDLPIGRLLSVLATITAAVFASVGAATESKKDGEITAWGWISIIGVITSAVLALLITTVDAASSAKEAAEAQARYETTYRATNHISGKLNTTLRGLDAMLVALNDNIARSRDIQHGMTKAVNAQSTILAEQHEIAKNTLKILNPFDLTDISVSLKYEVNQPGIQSYLAHIREYAEGCRPKSDGRVYVNDDHSIIIQWRQTPEGQSELSAVHLSGSSPLWPFDSPDTRDTAAAHILSNGYLIVDFDTPSSRPIKLDNGSIVLYGGPDRRYEVSLSRPGAKDASTNRPGVAMATVLDVSFLPTPYVSQFVIGAPARIVMHNGRIQGRSDIAGGLLCLSIHPLIEPTKTEHLPSVMYCDLGFGPRGVARLRFQGEAFVSQQLPLTCQFSAPIGEILRFEH